MLVAETLRVPDFRPAAPKSTKMPGAPR